MENKNLRIRINLVDREFEADGDSEYIMSRFGDFISECMEIIKEKDDISAENKSPDLSKDTPSLRGDRNPSFPDSFGEYFSRFNRNTNNVEKLLIAGFFVQNRNSEGKFFTLKDVNEILLDTGIKLSNPSVFLSQNIATKRVFKVTGKNYRVSDSGAEYIQNLSTLS
jgi:hypothetical protein